MTTLISFKELVSEEHVSNNLIPSVSLIIAYKQFASPFDVHLGGNTHCVSCRYFRAYWCIYAPILNLNLFYVRELNVNSFSFCVARRNIFKTYVYSYIAGIIYINRNVEYEKGFEHENLNSKILCLLCVVLCCVCVCVRVCILHRAIFL